MMRGAALCLVALTLAPAPSQAGQSILLSANDGLQTFAAGAYKMREHPGLGTLSAYDPATTPPRPLWAVPLEQTAIGPPTAVAATPDGRLALIGNPAVVDPANPAKIKMTEDLQIVALHGSSAPASVERLSLKHHPWSVAVSPDGRLAATANGDGTLTLLRISGVSVTPIVDVRVGAAGSQNTGVAFSRDGRYLLASRRRDDLVSLYRVEGESVTPVRDITVGSNPYEIVVSPDGKLAAVSNVGRTSGDNDSVSLIDLSADPVRTTGIISVGPTPEGIAFAPDSRHLAVNSINGSNLKPDSPFHREHSLIQVFDLGSGAPLLVGAAEVGANAQGLAFSPDGATLIVQDYASDRLVSFAVGRQSLTEATGSAVSVEGGPSALVTVEVKPSP